MRPLSYKTVKCFFTYWWITDVMMKWKQKSYLFIQVNKINYVFKRTLEQIVLDEEVEHDRIVEIYVNHKRLFVQLLILVSLIFMIYKTNKNLIISRMIFLLQDGQRFEKSFALWFLLLRVQYGTCDTFHVVDVAWPFLNQIFKNLPRKLFNFSILNWKN